MCDSITPENPPCPPDTISCCGIQARESTRRATATVAFAPSEDLGSASALTLRLTQYSRGTYVVPDHARAWETPRGVRHCPPMRLGMRPPPRLPRPTSCRTSGTDSWQWDEGRETFVKETYEGDEVRRLRRRICVTRPKRRLCHQSAINGWRSDLTASSIVRASAPGLRALAGSSRNKRAGGATEISTKSTRRTQRPVRCSGGARVHAAPNFQVRPDQGATHYENAG